MPRSAHAFSMRSCSSSLGDDRDRDQVVRGERLRVGERLEHAAVQAADEHDDRVVHPAAACTRRDAQARGHPVVVALDRLEQQMIAGRRRWGATAPLVNFVPATMSSTMNVAVAPTPLMTVCGFQPGLRSRRWCRTMPDCDSVNDGEHADRVERDSAFVMPPNATIGRRPRPRARRCRSRRRAGRRGRRTGGAGSRRGRRSTTGAGSRRTRCWRRASGSRP